MVQLVHLEPDTEECNASEYRIAKCSCFLQTGVGRGGYRGKDRIGIEGKGALL